MKSRVSRLLSVLWILVLAAGMLQTPSSVVQAAPTELFFSEYIEGSSNNKALEIFNGTGAAINLGTAGYNIQVYFNGSVSSTLTISLTGAVANGDVYVLAHSSANATILAQADQTNGAGWFNGDDAVVLRKGTTIVDSIGQIGFDPGTEWGTGLVSTADNTLRRATAVEAGDPNATDLFDPSLQWRGFATDTFSGLGAHPNLDLAPSVATTSPVNGYVLTPVGANLTVTFNEPVAVIGSWFTLTCSLSGSVTAAVSGGPTSFTLDPSVDFAADETCSLTVFASGISDLDLDDPPDNMSGDYTTMFATYTNQCVIPTTPIYAIQGSGASAAITGPVVTQGVVVGDYEGASPTLRGFYLQDASGDSNAATSDGIFVFNANNNFVSLGDLVSVAGIAEEFQDQTQIGALSVAVCGTGSLAPVDVNMPFDSAIFLEQYEGMLVRFPQKLYVTEHFQLGRFGQVVVSSSGRLAIPTHLVEPGASAQAVQAANNLNRIIIDDPLNNQNPDPILFGRDGLPLSASNTLRGGDSVTDLVGVMTYTWSGNSTSGNAYRLRPINALGGGAPNFIAENVRPDTSPQPGGELKVAGMNLLNYFNTFTGCANGVGGEATGCRGAENSTEFGRQTAKTVAAIQAIGADVIGIVEIENDGYGPDSAIADLVTRLNTAAGEEVYAFIDADAATEQVNALGFDAIKVGFIYKPAAVTPLGTAVLNTGAFGLFEIMTPEGPDTSPRSRPALAQTFEQVSDGARFTAVVNHLKSKGSTCANNISPVGPDPDTGDLQGECNLTRLTAASELATWLATDPTGSGDPDVLILGDLNSYALEDPIQALVNAGYTDLISHFSGLDGYSYVFDGQWGYLDHALSSANLSPQVKGVVEYHINSDEPSVLDYNTNFKSPGQIVSLYAPDEFRVADHDPVVVGLNPNVAPVVGAISAPVDPLALGAAAPVSASFSDADVNDTHTAVWDWGDGTSSAGTVTESGGAGTVQDSHTYAATGVYRVTLTVTDQMGDSGESVFEYVVVYNPKGGFVTGSGWFDSPTGAYSQDPTLTGKAEFNFDAKYLKGVSVPTGAAEFVFSFANLLFESSSYDWLVISGPKVQLKGEGVINGSGEYSFWLTGLDGAPDLLRIRIWDSLTGSVVYDSQPGGGDTDDPLTVLGGGSIFIHKGK